MRWAAGIVAWLAGMGCGGDGAASADAALSDALDAPAACVVEPGWSYVISAIHLVPADMGEDVDGDGSVDNELAEMPPAVLDAFHQAFADGIATGDLIPLVHMVGWGDPRTPDAPAVRIQVFTAFDADVPPDPTDNLSGDDGFWVSASDFDVNCRVTSEAGPAPLSGGAILVDRDPWIYPINPGIGTLAVSRARFRGSFDASFASFVVVLSGGFPFCSLVGVPTLTDTPGTILDFLVNDESVAATVSPDLDLDGDGLEQLIGDGVTVARCIDGDGTPIEGRDCVCHPAIADGYSFALRFDAVSARVVGILD